MRFPPWGGKRQFVTPGQLLDEGGHAGKRVRLTRKTCPGVSSHNISDPGHPTPRSWKRLRSLSSEGERGEVGWRASQSFSSTWGWVIFCFGDAWNLPSEGTGVGFFRLVGPAEGVSALALTHQIQCMCLRLHVRTTTTTTTTTRTRTRGVLWSVAVAHERKKLSKSSRTCCVLFGIHAVFVVPVDPAVRRCDVVYGVSHAHDFLVRHNIRSHYTFRRNEGCNSRTDYICWVLQCFSLLCSRGSRPGVGSTIGSP